MMPSASVASALPGAPSERTSAADGERPRSSFLAGLGDAAGRQNTMLLVQLRWVAVFGQAFTIVIADAWLKLSLPLAPMFAVIGGLVLLNFHTWLVPAPRGVVREKDLLQGLLFDIAALTALLYLGGGATNPFCFLYLLQVALGAILLGPRATWGLVALSIVCFAGLTRFYIPLKPAACGADCLPWLYVRGALACFTISVVLLVVFLTRISANLRRRDARLAELRQRAAEEDHIVRMGLLASGAAHELGTPLATLSVALNDWKRLPPFRDDQDWQQELAELETELKRCKRIVGGILLSAGEARGEAMETTTVRAFLDDIATDWRSRWPGVTLVYQLADMPIDDDGYDARTPIVADAALKQVLAIVLDNAAEVSPAWVGLTATCRHGELILDVRDRGPGFLPEILAGLGRPYQSSKGRPGGGLGLFLVVNVLRKLGGSVQAENMPGGGAWVCLRLPLAALALTLEEGRDAA